RRLRHRALQRALCAGLAASLLLAVALPAAGAPARRTVVVQLGADGVALPAAALEVALAEAVRAPTGLLDAFAAALAAQPGGADLARFLEAHPTPEALLVVLYDHLLRVQSPLGDLQAAPGSVITVPSAPPAAALKALFATAAPAPAQDGAVEGQAPGERVVIPLAVRSSA